MMPELLEAWKHPTPPEPRQETGFFTDTTVCIGCKACEIACKQWNQLPSDGFHWTGNSYDNTIELSDTTWRHVAFVEQLDSNGHPPRWLMMSDVCKHCVEAPCHDACPTGAIIYNEFGNVYVQQDICNGCAYCVAACPFGVLDRNDEDGGAYKCTLCYDRQKDGMTPACAKVCPTESIQFGPVEQLREKAQERVRQLHARGERDAYIYGLDGFPEYSSLNSIFLLKDHPNVYNLPEAPRRPVAHLRENYLLSFAAAIGMALASAFLFGRKA